MLALMSLVGIRMAVGEATPDIYEIVQGQTLTADGSAPNPEGVLANDTSVMDFAPLPFDVEGLLRINDDGTFTYTPPPQFFGSVSFNYQVSEFESVILVADDAPWKYIAPNEDPANTDPDFHNTWQNSAFDDQAWLAGSGLMGYGGLGTLPLDTPITPPPFDFRYTFYFRHVFQATPGEYDLDIELIRDDGAIVYLNGVEVERSHRGDQAFEDAPDTFTLLASNVSGNGESTPVSHSIGRHSLIAGPSILAVSLHNNSNRSSDGGLHFRELGGTRITNEPEIMVTINVTDAMVPPAITDDRYLIFEGSTLDSNTVSSLYANDGLHSASGEAYDPILEILISGSPEGQVTAHTQTGHFVFTPTPGFTGSTTFDYQVRDKDGLSDPATVTIETTDGRTVTNTVHVPNGAGCLGIDWATIDAKYRTLAPNAPLSGQQVEASLEVIHGFSEVKNVSVLIDLLR